MRKLTVLEHISMDGVIQAPGGPEEDTSGGFAYGGWIAPYSDEVLGTALRRQMNTPFDLLLGRITFDIGSRSGRNMRTNGQASTRRPSTSPRIPGLPANGSRLCF
jgi:hypothetical protein